LSSLFNGHGWIVPGVVGATAKSSRAKYKTSDSSVYVTLMTPGQESATVTRLQCSKSQPDATEVQTIDVEALQLWKFDLDGKVFAYGVTAGWMGREDRTGRLIELGTAEDLLFYDVDGTGKFKLMKRASFPFVPDIPRWVSTSPVQEPLTH
jgi:hypothetical protein